MTLENAIRDVLNQKLTDGTVEKLVAENVEKGIDSALRSMFTSYGDMTKIIENKLKEVMIPYIEGHDFSQYLVKLDSILMELSKSAIPENKKMLDNFKTLMAPPPKQITASELFEKWMEYAADEIETDGLDIDYDDEPTYESTEVTMSFEEFEKPSWSSFDYGQLMFESDHDEKLNIAIPLSKWDRREEWEIDKLQPLEINSLRYAHDFLVFLHSLKQANAKIVLDTTYETVDVTPNDKPEADWR